jgi:hypothetical protein
MRQRGRYAWLSGLPLGLIGLLLVWFVVLPLKAHPVAFGWQILPMIRSAIASLMWGLGVGILFPLLLRRLGFGTKAWSSRRLAA